MHYRFKVGDRVAFMEPNKPHYRGALPGKIIALTPRGYLIDMFGRETFSVDEMNVSESKAAKAKPES